MWPPSSTGRGEVFEVNLLLTGRGEVCLCVCHPHTQVQTSDLGLPVPLRIEESVIQALLPEAGSLQDELLSALRVRGSLLLVLLKRY
ncbi:unnamed protein product [Arctogadus glacialis]